MSKYVAMVLCILLGVWGISLILGGEDSLQGSGTKVMQDVVDTYKQVP